MSQEYPTKENLPADQEINDPMPNPCLKCVTTGTLEATTGERMFRGPKGVNLFHGNWSHLAWDSENARFIPSPKGETPFGIYQLTEEVVLAQVFEGFGKDIKSLCWTEDQIITFLQKHPELLNLETPRKSNALFLYKVIHDKGENAGEENFFVADVGVDQYGEFHNDVLILDGNYGLRPDQRFLIVVPIVS